MSKLSILALVSALVLAPSMALAADVSAAATTAASGNLAGQNDSRSSSASAAADVSGSASVGTSLGLGALVTNLNGTGDDGTALTAVGAATAKSTVVIVPVSSMKADASITAAALTAAETHASTRLGAIRAAIHGNAVVEAALTAKGYNDNQVVGLQADASSTITVYVDDSAK